MDYSEKSLKILALALDSAAPEGEWQAAAVRFVSGLRKSEVIIDDFKSTPKKSQSSPISMPFGKYKGASISFVDDGYLVWLHESASLREPLKTAVERELERRGL